jgi:hypothetical protein
MRLVMPLLLLLAACKAGDRKASEGRARKAPADAARVYSEADLASATYQSLDDVVGAGNAA